MWSLLSCLFVFLPLINQERSNRWNLKPRDWRDHQIVSVKRRAARSEPWASQCYRSREKRRTQRETEKHQVRWEKSPRESRVLNVSRDQCKKSKDGGHDQLCLERLLSSEERGLIQQHRGVNDLERTVLWPTGAGGSGEGPTGVVQERMGEEKLETASTYDSFKICSKG